MFTETSENFPSGIKPSGFRAVARVITGIHADQKTKFQVNDKGYVSKPIRVDLIGEAGERIEREKEAKLVFTVRYLDLLAKGRPIPTKDLTYGLREELFADEFKHLGIPLPSTLPKHFEPSVGLMARAREAVDKLMPELDYLKIFDHGREVKGDPNSKNILERMAAVQLGPAKVLVPEVWEDSKTGEKSTTYKEEWVSLGVKAFDFQLSDLVAQGVVSQKDFSQWQKITRLGDFRMRVFVKDSFLERNGGSLAKALQNAGVIFKGEMGWLSCLETLEQIPALLCNETENGVIITYDTPGQFKSQFKNPAEIDSDPFLETLQANNFATEATLHLLGLDRQELDQKFQVTIGHSKEATAQFFKTDELKRKDRGHVLLSPVPGHPFWSGKKVRWLLGRGTRAANMPIAREIVRYGVSHPLIQWFIGSASEDVKALHRRVLQNMDLRVVSRYILRLMSTEIPELPVEAISRDSMRIIIPAYDQFIDFNLVVDQTLGKIRREGIVMNMRRGHYGASFSDRMKGSPDDMYENYRSRGMLIQETVRILNHLERVLPDGKIERWKHPSHERQFQNPEIVALLNESDDRQKRNGQRNGHRSSRRRGEVSIRHRDRSRQQ